MSKGRSDVTPRNFFLNEQHELARARKEGGGGRAQYSSIDWVKKAAHISTSLSEARSAIVRSKDPLKESHYFMIALPVAKVRKLSKNKKKAPEGTYQEETNYAREHSRVFRRLGIDLLNVSDDGVASVHATLERFERLVATAAALSKERAAEQARWMTIDKFAPIPAAFRVDQSWLDTTPKTKPIDVIVELQPLLSRSEVEDVLRALGRTLKQSSGESFIATGADFSGRKWFRGNLRRSTIIEMAEQFFSVQSLHPPHTTAIAGSSDSRGRRRRSDRPRVDEALPDVSGLPTVAILDTGVPEGHNELQAYRRGSYQSPNAFVPFAGDHGSLVASRIVFGELDFDDGLKARPHGTCRYVDAMVAKDADEIDNKAIAPALDSIVATFPDVRVFNLSFGDSLPLAGYSELERRERLLLVQDLDNFVFARDVVVVVAAGNSPRNARPANDYPLHLDEPAWQLGAWPAGFNTLACGAIVNSLNPNGLVKTLGWPSPFSRLGPGIAAAPVPSYGAHGGNLGDDWAWRPSFGVWGCTASGDWEDRSGTSFAAPLLAREVAFAFDHLKRFCAPGSQPFGVTVKAFLALVAHRQHLPGPVAKLADRAISRGVTSAARLRTPRAESAMFMWQGIIDGPGEVVRVNLPVPRAWLRSAQHPRIRIVCSWDPPVSEAVREIWACRKVIVHLKPSASDPTLHPPHGHPSYPLIDRTYDVSAAKMAKQKIVVHDDMWLVELMYEQTAEYYTGITFASQQRVAFAAELFDASETPVSPQAAIQALPAAASMTRLALPGARLPIPIVLRKG